MAKKDDEMKSNQIEEKHPVFKIVKDNIPKKDVPCIDTKVEESVKKQESKEEKCDTEERAFVIIPETVRDDDDD